MFFPLYALPVSRSDWFRDLEASCIVLFGLNSLCWTSCARMHLVFIHVFMLQNSVGVILQLSHLLWQNMFRFIAS